MTSLDIKLEFDKIYMFFLIYVNSPFNKTYIYIRIILKKYNNICFQKKKCLWNIDKEAYFATMIALR